ncbi:hypothetical protein Tco_0380870 [Tanacetum coccineum]
MEMEHYLEYIDNDVWKVIQNGNSKKRISTRKDGVVRILPPVSAVEIHVVEKERRPEPSYLWQFQGISEKISWNGLVNTLFQQLLSPVGKPMGAVSYQLRMINHKFPESLPPAGQRKEGPAVLDVEVIYSLFANNLKILGLLYGPQKPEISDSDDKSNEHSTCQSNDSEGSCGNTSEHSSESESESISVTNEMSTSKSVITNEKVVSESKEVEPSCAKHVKTPRQQMKNQGTSEVKGKN